MKIKNTFINWLQKLKSFLIGILYELKANFIPQKIRYRLEGYCSKCGDCCRYMYSSEIKTEKEFEFYLNFHPEYRRFKIIGKDEYGNLILACSLIDETNLCPDYKNRLKMCKNYPNLKRIRSGGNLYRRCTYRLVPEKDFKSFLD